MKNQGLFMIVGSQGDRKGLATLSPPYPTTQKSPVRFVYGRGDPCGRPGLYTFPIFGG